MNATEIKLNIMGAHFWLPPIRAGRTRAGLVHGGHAEVQYAGLHKSWTATRLLGAVATLGASTVLGRKQKGSATLVVTYGNGAVRVRRLKAQELAAAQGYAAEFTAYAKRSPIGGVTLCDDCGDPIDFSIPPGAPECAVVDGPTAPGVGVRAIHAWHAEEFYRPEPRSFNVGVEPRSDRTRGW